MKDRAYKYARNCEYDGHREALANMVYKFLDKSTGISVKDQLV